MEKGISMKPGARKLWTRVIVGAAGIMLAPFFSYAVQAGETITIAGSSTVRPIVDAAVIAFKKDNPGVQMVVGGGGSSGGVKNAGEGKVDVGMASRKIKAKEKNAYPDLVPTVIGQDGVAMIVNKSAAIDNLTTEQIFKIYTGRMANWKDLGGKDLPISLVGILLHHGTAEVFMKFAGLEGEERGEGGTKTICYWKKGGEKRCAFEARGVDGNQPSSAAVMTSPSAVSFASIGFARSLADKGAPVKLLKLNGIEPTSANVVSGVYPLSRPLLVMTKGEAKGSVKKFVDYLLSEDGQAIVKDKDYIPIK